MTIFFRMSLLASAAAIAAASPSIGAESRDPRQSIGRANDAARVHPARATFQGAIQEYPWAEGALFQVYCAPGQITDIVLQEGEELVGPGPVAAGDTARWIIGDTVSGAGPARRIHILIKPTRAELATNMIINTSRRTYRLELRATQATYMAAVSWTYPHDELIALRASEAAAERARPVAAGVELAALNFAYRISGDKVPWRPLRIFDDGRQLFVEFASGVSQGDMPPLFIIGDTGQAELVNYRVDGRYMIVDRLFEKAELRLGVGRGAKKIRVEREPRRSRS